MPLMASDCVLNPKAFPLLIASPRAQIAAYQASGGDASQLSLSNAVLAAFRSTLLDTTLEPSLRAYTLSLPDFSTLAQVRILE